MHLEDAESLVGRDPVAGMALLLQPALEGVGAEVLAHDHHGPALGGQAGQPGQQQLVQGGLADANGWVGPDLVVPSGRIDLIGEQRVDPGVNAEGRGIVCRQGERAPC